MASPVTRTAGAPSVPTPTPTVVIKTGTSGPATAADVRFHVQIAATPEEHANGLTGRPSLAVDAGLLFVYRRPAIQTLSMKDTLIPVDMIFIGANRRIVGIIEKAAPLSATPSRIGVASKFVLQIRGGLSAQHGFKVGQAVAFQAIPGV